MPIAIIAAVSASVVALLSIEPSAPLSDLIQAFGDPLALRRERAQYHLLRLTAWLGPIWALAFCVTVIYLFTRSWPDLFTGQERTLSMSGGLILVILIFPIAINIKNQFRALSKASAMDPNSTYASGKRGMALALLEAAQARDAALAPTAARDGIDAPLEHASEASSAMAPPASEDIAPLAHPLMTTTLPALLYWLWMAFGLTVMVGIPALAAYCAASNLNIFDGISATAPDIGLILAVAIASIAGALTGGMLMARARIAWSKARAARRGMTARVDGESLTVRYLGARGRAWGEARIAWGEARTLAHFRYSDETMGQHTVYLLDAEHATILWEAPPIRRFSPEKARTLASAQRAAADHLLAAALAGTKLPLLDLTQTLAALREDRPGYGSSPRVVLLRGGYAAALRAEDQPLALSLRRLLFPPQPGETPGEPRWNEIRREESETYALKQLTASERERMLDTLRALLPYLPARRESDPAIRDGRLPTPPPQRVAKKANKFLLSSGVTGWLYLLFTCAFVFFPGQIASATSSYSAPLERALPATVAGMTPTYFAPLDTPRPGWLVKSPGGSDTRSAQFTPQGYTLAAPDMNQTLAASAPGTTMGDGASQVSVSLSAPISPDSSPRAGLLLQNRDGTTGVAFEMENDGYWSLNQCKATSGEWSCETDLAFGGVSGIQAGTPFTLLLVRRGTTYFLYLNGTLLQAVHDDSQSGAPGGQVSLFLDQGGGSAQFSDLLIYPTPAGLPFWAR